MTRYRSLFSATTPNLGINLAIYGSFFFSFLLITSAFNIIFLSLDSFFNTFKATYFLVFALYIRLPSKKLADRVWLIYYISICLLSVGFVFLMVVDVLYQYMDAADVGERLGVPGFEGTLIFLSLLQIPTFLFYKKPHLLN